eukprot:3246400-Prymnesium_polylepis.1
MGAGGGSPQHHQPFHTRAAARRPRSANIRLQGGREDFTGFGPLGPLPLPKRSNLGRHVRVH